MEQSDKLFAANQRNAVAALLRALREEGLDDGYAPVTEAIAKVRAVFFLPEEPICPGGYVVGVDADGMTACPVCGKTVRGLYRIVGVGVKTRMHLKD